MLSAEVVRPGIHLCSEHHTCLGLKHLSASPSFVILSELNLSNQLIAVCAIPPLN